MNSYTHEDIAVLAGMVDAIKNNVNNVTVAFSRYNRHVDWHVLQSCPPDAALAEILNFIVPLTIENRARKAVFEDPLEEMPLLINEANALGIIAQWRLRISK
jgi:hypothetical protein